MARLLMREGPHDACKARGPGRARAKTSQHSHVSGALMATVMLLVAVVLPVAGERLHPEAEQGVPSIALIFFWVWVGLCPVAMCCTLYTVCCGDKDDECDGIRVTASCCLCCSSGVVFCIWLVIMALSWWRTLVICDDETLCHGKGHADCGTDSWSALKYPQCLECFEGWRGPTCDQEAVCTGEFCHGRGTVHGRGASCSCQCYGEWVGPTCASRICDDDLDCSGRGHASGTFDTIYNVRNCICACNDGYSGASCELEAGCPRGSLKTRSPVLDPDEHCEKCLDGMGTISEHSTQCDAGVQVGWPLGISIGVAVVPLFCACAALALSKATWEVRFEVLVSSLDLASDLFWILKEHFYVLAVLIVALVLTCGHSLIFAARLASNTPGRPLPYRIVVHALASIKKMQHFMRSLPAKLWRGLWLELAVNRLKTSGFFQVFPKGNRLEMQAANLLTLLILVIAIMLDSTLIALIVVVATVLAILAAILLMILALLSALTVFVCFMGIGMLLHATRLLAVQGVRDYYLQLWGDSASTGFTWALEKELWDRIILYELIFESLPQLALNVTNIILMSVATSSSGFTLAASLSVAGSSWAVLTVAYRFLYDTSCCRQPLGRGDPRPPGPVGAAMEAAAAAAGGAADAGVNPVRVASAFVASV